MAFRDTIHRKQNWGIEIHPISRKVGTPTEEINHVINRILHEAAGKPIAVLASGGIDSEAMIHLLARRTHVTALAFEFLYEGNILNAHDLEYLKPLEHIGGVNTVRQSLNLKEFWESDWYWDFIAHYINTSPQLPVHAYMAEQAVAMGYYPVLTEMQPELKLLGDGKFYFEEKEKDYAVVKYLRDNNVHCCESPLQSTPEMLYSILTSSEFQQYMANPQGHLDSSAFKRDQYRAWFDIDLQERPKYHGFEGSEEIDNRHRKQIFDRTNYADVRLFIPYDVLVSTMTKAQRVFTTVDEDVVKMARRGFNPI